MTVYIAMDDTDNLESRGTGRLARSVGTALAENFRVFGITRHQLYVNEAIPYTSHNSCAVIHLPDAVESDIPDIFSQAREMMLDDFIEGSDPGLAVADASRISPAHGLWQGRKIDRAHPGKGQDTGKKSRDQA